MIKIKIDPTFYDIGTFLDHGRELFLITLTLFQDKDKDFLFSPTVFLLYLATFRQLFFIYFAHQLKTPTPLYTTTTTPSQKDQTQPHLHSLLFY